MNQSFQKTSSALIILFALCAHHAQADDTGTVYKDELSGIDCATTNPRDACDELNLHPARP